VEPARRGEAASSLFVIAYLGLIIPILGIGIATLVVSAQTAMLFFAGALLVILAGIATLSVRRAVRPAIPEEPSEVASVAGTQHAAA
jgi:hypothetical protein